MNPRNVSYRVASNAEWLEARLALLAKEKEFTRLRDELSEARRNLPWQRVSKTYVFDGPHGKASLADIFDGSSQLIVFHFIFAPEWEAGCKHCSWWAVTSPRLPAYETSGGLPLSRSRPKGT